MTNKNLEPKLLTLVEMLDLAKRTPVENWFPWHEGGHQGDAYFSEGIASDFLKRFRIKVLKYDLFLCEPNEEGIEISIAPLANLELYIGKFELSKERNRLLPEEISLRQLYDELTKIKIPYSKEKENFRAENYKREKADRESRERMLWLRLLRKGK